MPHEIIRALYQRTIDGRCSATLLCCLSAEVNGVARVEQNGPSKTPPSIVMVEDESIRLPGELLQGKPGPDGQVGLTTEHLLKSL
jgi:hypothetical protein